MRTLIRLLGGLGLRVEAEIIQHRTTEVEVAGVRWPVPLQIAQALELEQRRTAAALAAVNDTAITAIEAAQSREREALARAEAAEARMRVLETELVATRIAAETSRAEAVRIGVAAAREERELSWLASVPPIGHA